MANGINEILDESTPSVRNAFLTYEEKEKRLARLADKSIRSSRIRKTRNVNPFLDWSAEVVEAVKRKPDRSELVTKTEVRDIKRMHEHNRKDPTVASLKIVKENTDINTVKDNFRQAIRDPNGLTQTNVLFSTTNFMLQAAGETDSEKFQILDNFGKPQIFLFGRKPRLYAYSGMLWNTKLNNWKDEFKYIWDRYLRGTKAVENGAKILLTYDRSVRVGYLVNVNINQSAETDMAVPINFTMFIESEKENLDLDVIDPTRNVANNQLGDFEDSAFRLVNEQRKNTDENARVLNEAINRKIVINEIAPAGQPDKPPPQKGTSAAAMIKRKQENFDIIKSPDTTQQQKDAAFTDQLNAIKEEQTNQEPLNKAPVSLDKLFIESTSDGTVGKIIFDPGTGIYTHTGTGDTAVSKRTDNPLFQTTKDVTGVVLRNVKPSSILKVGSIKRDVEANIAIIESPDSTELQRQKSREKLHDIVAQNLKNNSKFKQQL